MENIFNDKFNLDCERLREICMKELNSTTCRRLIGSRASGFSRAHIAIAKNNKHLLINADGCVDLWLTVL